MYILGRLRIVSLLLLLSCASKKLVINEYSLENRGYYDTDLDSCFRSDRRPITLTKEGKDYYVLKDACGCDLITRKGWGLYSAINSKKLQVGDIVLE